MRSMDVIMLLALCVVLCFGPSESKPVELIRRAVGTGRPAVVPRARVHLTQQRDTHTRARTHARTHSLTRTHTLTNTNARTNLTPTCTYTHARTHAGEGWSWS